MKEPESSKLASETVDALREELLEMGERQARLEDLLQDFRACQPAEVFRRMAALREQEKMVQSLHAKRNQVERKLARKSALPTETSSLEFCDHLPPHYEGLILDLKASIEEAGLRYNRCDPQAGR